MRPLTAVLDRLACLVLGLVLLGAGAAAVLWQTRRGPGWPARLSARWAGEMTAAPWWPWATALVGVALALLGLRWLAAHLPVHRVPDLPLDGSDTAGRLRVDLGDVAAATAETIDTAAGVRSTTGRGSYRRGRPTLELTAVIEPSADLAPVTAAADRAHTELVAALGDQAPDTDVHLHVARTDRASRDLA